MALRRRGRGAPRAQPPRRRDARTSRLRPRHREDPQRPRVQPLCGQDPGVLLRGKRRHLPARAARAAREPYRAGYRQPARAQLRPHRGDRARPRRGAYALRACRRALLVGMPAEADGTLLQPQRAFGARARPAVPAQPVAPDARRGTLPQRGVRPAAPRARGHRLIRQARRARDGMRRGRAHDRHATTVHARRVRRARKRHDRLRRQGPPRRHRHGRPRIARSVRDRLHRRRQRAYHQQPDRRHREQQLRTRPHRHE